MAAMPIGELKARFSEVLDLVQEGESMTILRGRAKKPVARIVPIMDELPSKRPVGLLRDSAKITIPDDFKFESTEEFLGLV